MKKTKFDRYRDIYADLAGGFGVIPNTKLKSLIESWKESFAQMDDWLSNAGSGVTKSRLAPGLEQGLVDTYYLISELSDADRPAALDVFVSSCRLHDSGFVDRINERCNEILARGKITSETEHNLIRNKVDELMLLDESAESLSRFQSLLDKAEL